MKVKLEVLKRSVSEKCSLHKVYDVNEEKSININKEKTKDKKQSRYRSL